MQERRSASLYDFMSRFTCKLSSRNSREFDLHYAVLFGRLLLLNPDLPFARELFVPISFDKGQRLKRLKLTFW